MKHILFLALAMASASTIWAAGSVGDIPIPGAPAATAATPEQNYFAAVRRGDVTAVRSFLDSGNVNINAKEPGTGMNSLMIATDRVDLPMVLALINYRPTAQDRDNQGRTVSQIAAGKANPQLSSTLAGAGY